MEKKLVENAKIIDKNKKPKNSSNKKKEIIKLRGGRNK